MGCRRALAAAWKRAANPRGAVVVWVSAASARLVLAAALVLNVELLYTARARLQAIADAAALAGAQGLPSPERARELAEEYLQRNGVPASQADRGGHRPAHGAGAGGRAASRAT